MKRKIAVLLALNLCLWLLPLSSFASEEVTAEADVAEHMEEPAKICDTSDAAASSDGDIEVPIDDVPFVVPGKTCADGQHQADLFWKLDRYHTCSGGYVDRNGDPVQPYHCTVCRTTVDADGYEMTWKEGDDKHVPGDEYGKYSECGGGYKGLYFCVYCGACVNADGILVRDDGLYYVSGTGKHTPGSVRYPANSLYAEDYYYCVECGAAVDENGNKLTPVEEEHSRHTPDFSRPAEYTVCGGGYKDCYYCSVCGEITDADGHSGEELYTSGTEKHTPNLNNAAEYTTCGGGYKECFYCSVCGSLTDAEGNHLQGRDLDAYYVSGDGFHTPGSVQFKADYTDCGGGYKSDYYICTDCGAYVDEYGDGIIRWDSGNGRHTPGAEAHTVNFTDCNGGWTASYYICEVCGAECDVEGLSYYSSNVYKWGYVDHTPGDVLHEADYSICDGGYKYDYYICTACGRTIADRSTVWDIFYKDNFVYHSISWEMPIDGHTPGAPVRENEAAAACSTAGSVDLVTYCETCGTELSRTTQTIEATGAHDWSDWTMTQEPTCSTMGEETRTCFVCGETSTRRIAVSHLAHKLTIVAAKDATAVENGNKAYWYCELCGQYFADAEGTVKIALADTVIPAIGTPVDPTDQGGNIDAGDHETATDPIDQSKNTDEPAAPLTGAWKKNGRGWWYQYSDGSYPAGEWAEIDGVWYHFNASGYMQTGWYSEDGAWYFLKSSGAMATGWVKSGGKWYFMDASGVMQTGWIEDGGSRYYLNASGAMVTGWQNADGTWYYFNASGVLRTNSWLKSGGYWYYMDETGAMHTGWLDNGGATYYLKSSGVMATGWQQIGEHWYYFNGSGVMRTDSWLKSSGSWYYLLSDGTMAADTYIGGDYVNASGVWVR